MPTLRFSTAFMLLCGEYLKLHPEVARDAKELLRRCGRLAAYKLEETLEADPWRAVQKSLLKGEAEDLIAVHIPEEDAERIRGILSRYGVFRTLSSFYYFSALMILLGVWELPPRI